MADILTLLTADPATATAFFKVSQSSPAFVKASLKDLRDLLPRSPGSPSTPIPSPTPAPDTTTALLEVQSAAYQADASAYRLLENAKRADRLYEVSAGALEKEADASKRPQLQTAADQARAQRDKAWDDYVKQRTKADSLKATANTLAEAPSQEERLLDLLLGLDTELNRDLYAYSKQYKNDVVSREIVDEYWRDPVWSTTDASGARVHSRQVGAFFEVYRKLVDAQIVPNRIGAKPGDVIIVDLLVYPESQPSTAAAPGSPESNADKFVAFTVAEVHVFSFGWRVAVADSFLLIKRLEEGNAADPNHVPNNYRPAPGASLTWSEIPRPESTECFISCWVARNIAPSYGFNVSFVNFDKTKTFEIGLGGVIGLFRDQIQVGAGVNLSGDGSFKNRSYFFIGLSFARLAEKLGGPMHIGTLGEKPSP